MIAWKSIAEMLVETMARIAAADLRAEANAEVAYVDLIASGYRAAASDIVAAVYGPPCGTMVRNVPDYSAARGFAVLGVPPPPPTIRAVEWPEGRPGDECSRCGWPRSFHQ